MASGYKAPTRTYCEICEKIESTNNQTPIIDVMDAKASSANNFPVHNWYNFVLGYTPKFPNYIIRHENISIKHTVLDPFMGAGTTLVECKLLGIRSKGIDANDFMYYAVKSKINWKLNIDSIEKIKDDILDKIIIEYSKYNWQDDNLDILVEKIRPKMLVEKYISNKPLLKINIIKNVIEKNIIDDDISSFFKLGLNSIIIPISNVKYGPGFGVKKPKDDDDVYSAFRIKINRMIDDLKSLTPNQINTECDVKLGDTRKLSSYFPENSIDYMITSPPYPGDHEYTKHTRLELIFNNLATDINEFRDIKKRMLRASTTNIYKEDFDKELVANFESIIKITSLIDERLIADNATSGFEKLYTKLIWEYFGGMHRSLSECYNVLKPGGTISLLVSDSHAFKMVHIETAKILKEIGENIGFVDSKIILWQAKQTTSHKYQLRENILILKKPK